MVSGTVKSRVKDFEGQPIGKADKNSILDTRESAKLGANIIAECMYAHCDIEGNQYRLMDHIVITRESAKLGANIIAECMYAHCDIEGNQYRLMDHIVITGRTTRQFLLEALKSPF